MSLVPACICGQSGTTFEAISGLPMLRCSCGVLRQDVQMTLAEYATYYRRVYHDAVYYHTLKQDREVARLRLDAYRLSGDARILDVGCGNGAFVEEAVARGYDAWGQDLAEQSDGPRVYVGPLPDIAFPTGHFDVVTVHDVLEHAPDPRAMLREIRRVLKPGGRLIVDFPRFHHPAGQHHWKRTEHLWMLTEEQLVALLGCAGFDMSALTHPVESKVVVYAIAREITSKRILVPPGIGDGYWVAAKLRGFAESKGIELPEVVVHDAGPRRSGEMWDRIPFVRFGGYWAVPPSGKPITDRAYTDRRYPLQPNVLGCDYMMSFNGTLGAGVSLDAALPGPTDWYPPLFRPKHEAAKTAEYRECWGRYVVTGWWEQGFYRHWLAEFGEADIVATLRLLADAGVTPVVTGADWDKAGIAPRIANADRRFVNLVGATSFDDLTALLAGAAGVFGFPAGSTLLGPYFRRPTLLLWHRHFPAPMWTNCVPPDAHYRAMPTMGARPHVLAGDLLRMMEGS